MNDGKIAEGELRRLFGDRIPLEAVDILLHCPPDWTVERVRQEIRAIAEHPKRNEKAPRG